MTTASVRQASLWALMAAEAAFAVILLSGLLTRSAPPSFLGPAAALALLPAGYLAVRSVPALGSVRVRLVVGVVASLLLRLLLTWSPAEGEMALVPWIALAIVPGAIGLALWWRGGALAEADLTAAQIRDEVFLLGGALLLLLSLLRMVLSLSGPPLLLALVVFVGGGLLAVAMARQDAAGSVATGSARFLDVGAVVAVLVAGIVLIGILQPGLVATLWQGLGLLLGLLGNLLLLLLQPLLNLFAGLRPAVPPMPVAPLGPGPAGPPADRPGEAAPGWLAWLLLLVAVGVVLILAVVLMWLILALLSPLWRRALPATGSEGQIDAEGGAGEDARALLGGLRRWLNRLVSGTARTLGIGPGRERVSDARAAYRVLLRWARREGVERASAETTWQFRQRLDERLPISSGAYEALTDSYEQERYGEHALPASRLALLEEHLAQLEQARRQETEHEPR